jgi:N6-L-threonylcarbamoyladenine synthase
MKILGIETSCDETAAAVVADGRCVLSNQIASQVAIHARYGGIVPEVASRQHVLTIIPVVEQALKEAKVGFNELAGLPDRG